jgi:hypothetical protein
MNKNLHLSADERSVVLFCLDSYRDSVKNSHSAIDSYLATFHLSPQRADALIETLYSRDTISSSLAIEVRDALQAWEAVSGQSTLPLEPLYSKLAAFA